MMTLKPTMMINVVTMDQLIGQLSTNSLDKRLNPIIMMNPFNCLPLKRQVQKRPLSVQQQSFWQRSEDSWWHLWQLSKVFEIFWPHPGLFLSEVVSLCFVLMQHTSVLDNVKTLRHRLEMAVQPQASFWVPSLFLSFFCCLKTLLFTNYLRVVPPNQVFKCQ